MATAGIAISQIVNVLRGEIANVWQPAQQQIGCRGGVVIALLLFGSLQIVQHSGKNFFRAHQGKERRSF